MTGWEFPEPIELCAYTAPAYMVGLVGNDPTYSALQADTNPSQLQSHIIWRTSRESDPISTVNSRLPNHLASSP